MARPSRSSEIELAMLQAVDAHPRDLVSVVARQLGLSTARISTQVRHLVASGYLDKSGTTRPTYSLGRNRRSVQRYVRRSLAEDVVWSSQLASVLRGLAPNVFDIAHYGVTEMVNNAIDHSGAVHVTVAADLRDDVLHLVVADDGVGIFRKIAQALVLPDERLSLLELAKGKLTTDPRHHTGEGVFFTTRVFDEFRIVANDLTYAHAEGDAHDVLFDTDDLPPAGTAVFMAIATTSPRTLKQVFDAYSSGPDDYDFAKTVVPVRLARVGAKPRVTLAGQVADAAAGSLPPCGPRLCRGRQHRAGVCGRDLPGVCAGSPGHRAGSHPRSAGNPTNDPACRSGTRPVRGLTSAQYANSRNTWSTLPPQAPR